MTSRSIEDQLREEYFTLLPELTRAAEDLKLKIQYGLIPVVRRLLSHESLIVKSRVKECTSAIDALRRRNVGGVFDRDKPETYTLRSLRDLVGVRVLVFPPARAVEVDSLLHSFFGDWTFDPVVDVETGEHLAFKYYGEQNDAKYPVVCEYQIVSMLIGLFWEVEHAAIYKPSPNLKGLAISPEMRERTSAVYESLKAFEDEFERQVRLSDLSV